MQTFQTDFTQAGFRPNTTSFVSVMLQESMPLRELRELIEKLGEQGLINRQYGLDDGSFLDTLEGGHPQILAYVPTKEKQLQLLSMLKAGEFPNVLGLEATTEDPKTEEQINYVVWQPETGIT